MADEYGIKIARAALEIGAIKISPEEPFTWASGYRMPVYNDNRLLLGNLLHRMVVAEGLRHLIEEHYGGNISRVDYIAGTSTAGIPPATSTAGLMGRNLLIQQKERPYLFDLSSRTKYCCPDLVASTCPWGIPGGVMLANQLEVPFLYVRQSVKDHGMRQQIEGIPQAGKTAVLIDDYYEHSYRELAEKALFDQGIILLETLSGDISNDIAPPDLRGKLVVVVEDLISTGESSVCEVDTFQKLGSDVDLCVSIFSYDFPRVDDLFEANNCIVRSLLTYDVLLQTAIEGGYINQEQREILAVWRKSPFSWGEERGFPRVEKTK